MDLLHKCHVNPHQVSSKEVLHELSKRILAPRHFAHLVECDAEHQQCATDQRAGSWTQFRQIIELPKELRSNQQRQRVELHKRRYPSPHLRKTLRLVPPVPRQKDDNALRQVPNTELIDAVPLMEMLRDPVLECEGLVEAVY